MLIAFGLFNYIALSLSGEFNKNQFLLLSIAPVLVALPLFAINLFISTFFHKNKKTIGISLGIVFLFYIISIVSELSSSVEFLKYFSIYTLSDVSNIMTNVKLNPIMIPISIAITVLFIVGSYIRYNKKELV
jgi:ABC-2 type transport system permease protein